MKNLFKILLAKVIKKSVSDVVYNPDVKPVAMLGDDTKKELWKFILQTLISILTAILTALGATSCMGVQ